MTERKNTTEFPRCEDWTCPNCGREENGDPPHSEWETPSGEITVDVTCSTVYLMRDDGYGIALDYGEFEHLVNMFNTAKEAQE